MDVSLKHPCPPWPEFPRVVALLSWSRCFSSPFEEFMLHPFVAFPVLSDLKCLTSKPAIVAA